eukprot:gene14241-biopygen23107
MRRRRRRSRRRKHWKVCESGAAGAAKAEKHREQGEMQRDSGTSLYGILTCIELGGIAAAHGSNTKPRLLRAGPFGKCWCARWPLPPQISLHAA